MSSLRREIHFAVYLLLCTTCLQAFTWSPSLVFLLLQFNRNIYTVFLLANMQLRFSNVSAWSDTLVLTPKPWPWWRSWISQSCLVRCAGFGLVLESLEHNPNFMLFSSELLVTPTSPVCKLATCTLIFLVFPMRATTCGLVIINPSVWWLINCVLICNMVSPFFNYFSRNCLPELLQCVVCIVPWVEMKISFSSLPVIFLLDLSGKQRSKSSSLHSLESRSDFWRSCFCLKYVLQFSLF